MEAFAPAPPDMTVRSADGVDLAVYAVGEGPPLLLVHGSLQDHTISAALMEALASDVTCYAMDRRGFGASGDKPGYSIEREFEDVAAVVDHIASESGRGVHLWGHSYGASCAMGGAARTSNVDHLILYEPSLGLPYPPGVIEQIEAAVTAGDHDSAIVAVLRHILEIPDADIDAMRDSPEWARRLAAAPTVPRECWAEQGWVYEPGQFDSVNVPTLLLSGSESPAELKDATAAAEAALPQARVQVLAGHAHVAHRTDPAEVAAIILDFVRQP